MNNKLKNFLLLMALGCCWGPSFLFIRLAITEIPPFTLVAMRLWPGALLLLLFVLLRGENLRGHLKNWPHFVAMGFFASAFPFMSISTGQQYIPTSLAAIVNSTTPIFTAIGAHFLVGERLTWTKVIGILTGFCGILAIFVPALLDNSEHNERGIFLVLMASMSYAAGFLYSRKFLGHVPSMIGATAQVFAAALIVTPLACLYEKPLSMPLPSLTALSGIAGLAVFGTAIAFALYYTLSKSAGATYASTVTLLFPAIAVMLGVGILGERLSINVIVGCPIIFIGLAIANGIIRLPKISTSKSLSQT